MSLVFDQTPRLYARHSANLTWNSTDNSKFEHTREYLSRPAKPEGPAGQLLLPNNDQMPNSITMLYQDPSRLTPHKGTAPESETLHSGLFSFPASAATCGFKFLINI